MPVLQRASMSFFEEADLIVTTEVDLPAEINEVWAVIADNNSWPDWFKSCTSMESSHNPWTAAGQSRTIRVTPFVITEQSIEINPPHVWAMQFSRTNLPMATRAAEKLELTDTSRNGESRTQVVWTGAFNLPALLKPAKSIVEQKFLNTWGESLESLLDAVTSRR